MSRSASQRGHDPRPAGLSDGTRVAVTYGRASREDVAAVVVALDAAARADRGDRVAASAPAWLRAARIEGLGGRQVAAPVDLRGPG